MKTAALSTGAGCHLRRAAFAGFVGGYVMALAGYWLEAVLGVSDLDLAHSSLRYVSGGKQGWWVVGIIFHLIDSILLGLLYAAVFYRRADVLEKRWGPILGGVLAGCTFATGVWLVLGMFIAMPFMGAGVFARNTRSARPAIASLGLHLIFGTLLGAIYGNEICAGEGKALPFPATAGRG